MYLYQSSLKLQILWELSRNLEHPNKNFWNERNNEVVWTSTEKSYSTAQISASLLSTSARSQKEKNIFPVSLK